MKKIIFLLFACFAFMQNVSAQDYYESDSDIYGLGEARYQKKWNKSLSVSVGQQIEAGLTFRRNFGRYFAWDVYGFSYGHDFYGWRTDYDSKKYAEERTDVDHEIKFCRTGIRAFTPQWGKIKFYAAYGAAAEVILCERKCYDYIYGYGYSSLQKVHDDDVKTTAALCIDVQAGMYIGKKFSIGYQANFHSQGDCYINHTDHMVRMAIDF